MSDARYFPYAQALTDEQRRQVDAIYATLVEMDSGLPFSIRLLRDPNGDLFMRTVKSDPVSVLAYLSIYGDRLGFLIPLGSDHDKIYEIAIHKALDFQRESSI